MMILPAVVFILVSACAEQSARAEWGISLRGEVGVPSSSNYYGDRVTSEYRRGYQVDDWVERGASSVTDSPMFTDGIRLAAWATRHEEDYDYGLASAIYFFEVPSRARSIRIKIYYEGEADRSDLNESVAGKVWIRKARIGNDYEEYHPSEGRYEDVDQPLYGDTFVLRERKHLEILRISAADHVIDGMMELHVVAEGKQRIDVKYVEAESYTSLPSTRVVTKYYGDYVWRPWYDYTYLYFYTGPTYHFSDYYYVRYTYPGYDSHYIGIRKRYNSYLSGYYVNRPSHHVSWGNVARVPSGTRRTWDRDRLSRWTSAHEKTRKSYKVVSAKTRPTEVRESRTRIRTVLADRSRLSPATARARSGVTTATSSQRRRAETSTTPSVRTRSSIDRTRSSTGSQTRVETRSGVKTRRDDGRPSARTPSSSPISIRSPT